MKRKIVIDLSHIAHANWNPQTSQNINLWKSTIFTSILLYIEKFSPNEVVLATDYAVENCWRVSFDKYYKWRKRQKDKINREKIFFKSELYKFIQELKDITPWKILFVEGCEADDIIGLLSFELNHSTEELIIISKDKDFHQLIDPPSITMYDPRKHVFVTIEDSYSLMLNHVFRGDSTDDIPNFLSDADSFANPEKKQEILRQKLIDQLINSKVDITQPFSNKEFADAVFTYSRRKYEKKQIPWSKRIEIFEKNRIMNNLERNKTLIWLKMIPDEIRSKIREEYAKQKEVSRENLEKYLFEKEMLKVAAKINTFFV